MALSVALQVQLRRSFLRRLEQASWARAVQRLTRALRRESLDKRVEVLRQALLRDEIMEDPRHVFGYRDQSRPRGGSTGRRCSALEGSSPSVDSAVDAQTRGASNPKKESLLPTALLASATWLPVPIEAPREVLLPAVPPSSWDITELLLQRFRDARAAGQARALLQITLTSCHRSERAEEALESAQSALKEVAILRLRAGDRLKKSYVKKLSVGGVALEFSAFPTTLLLELDESFVRVAGLSFDPMGPSTEARKIRAFLSGKLEPVPGIEHERMKIYYASGVDVLNAGFWRGGHVLHQEERRS